jgi:hypothetical protein
MSRPSLEDCRHAGFAMISAPARSIKLPDRVWEDTLVVR